MADYDPEVKRLLREAGCYPVRQGKGDHEIWYSPITGRKSSGQDIAKSGDGIVQQSGSLRVHRVLSGAELVAGRR